MELNSNVEFNNYSLDNDYAINDLTNLNISNNDESSEDNNNNEEEEDDENEIVNNNEKLNIVDEMFTKLNQQFTNSQFIIKTLALNVKILQKEVLKERREYLKFIAKNTKKKKKNVSGFAKPTLISNDLADFLNISRGSKVARTEVTKLLSEYIKKNNIQNPENKKEILLDDNLDKLFGKYIQGKKTIEWFGMQKYLKYHFIKN